MFRAGRHILKQALIEVGESLSREEACRPDCEAGGLGWVSIVREMRDTIVSSWVSPPLDWPCHFFPFQVAHKSYQIVNLLRGQTQHRAKGDWAAVLLAF